MLSDPAHTITATTVTPPRTLTTPPPLNMYFVTDISAGQYGLLIHVLPYAQTWMVCRVHRHLAYGTRSAPGSVQFVPPFYTLVDNPNVIFDFNAAGVVLEAGELVRVSCYLMSTNDPASTARDWPSPVATVDATVNP
jgi:hypothetical protein